MKNKKLEKLGNLKLRTRTIGFRNKLVSLKLKNSFGLLVVTVIMLGITASTIMFSSDAIPIFSVETSFERDDIYSLSDETTVSFSPVLTWLANDKPFQKISQHSEYNKDDTRDIQKYLEINNIDSVWGSVVLSPSSFGMPPLNSIPDGGSLTWGDSQDVQAYYNSTSNRLEWSGDLGISFVKSASYIIFKDGSLTKALNCSTGVIVSSNANSETVIQYVIDQLTSGGHIHIKQGSYELDDNIFLDDYITISGEGYSTELKFTTANKTIKIIGKTGVILENFRVNGNVGVVAGAGINISGTGATKCIIQHVFSHDAGADGIGFWQQSSYCSIENCITWDNGTNGTYIEGTGAGDSYRCRVIDCISITDGSNGVRFSDSAESIVKGNIIFQCGAVGIVIDNVDESIVSNNFIFDPVSGGISAASSDDLLIANNQVFQSGAASPGISLASTCSRGVIVGNIVKDAASSGIDVECSGAVAIGNNVYNSALKGIVVMYATDCVISGNHVENNGQNGIEVFRCQKCVISDNVCKNNSQGAAGGAYGIKFWDNSGAACTYNVVTGNVCYDDQGTQTQGYGIRELESSDYNIIAHNMLVDNLTGNLAVVGANTHVSDNLGYVSENGGAAANVADGGTIAHGLATTPTYVSVVGSVAGEIVQVTGLGATNITVAIKTNAGAAGTSQTIYWRAWI